jgi:hypothetical protein
MFSFEVTNVLILRCFRSNMSDGGCYFSLNGPCSYQFGAPDYEENLIIDCFGADRLKEYLGKGRLNLCLVYGVEPLVLSSSSGGRENAVMVTKSTFLSFALPHGDGNYFLRPDRVLGAIIFDPSSPPPDFQQTQTQAAIRFEIEQDIATKHRIGHQQRLLSEQCEKLRLEHISRHRKWDTNNRDVTESGLHATVSTGEGVDCDIEMAHVSKSTLKVAGQNETATLA